MNEEFCLADCVCKYCKVEVWGTYGARHQGGGSLALLTSSFVPFGRSGRVSLAA